MAGISTCSLAKVVIKNQYLWWEKLARYKDELLLTRDMWDYWELGACKPLSINAFYRPKPCNGRARLAL